MNYEILELEQRTEDWEKVRLGRVGGSESIGLTTTARMNTLVYLKAAEIATGMKKPDKFKSLEAQRGIDLEPEAIEYYEEEEMVSVYRVGYITNMKYKYLGLSPDGLVGDVGAVEVKCLDSKAHIEIIATGKVPKAHIPQLTSYFVVKDDLEWVDFVSYDDRVRSKPYFKVRVMREDLEREIQKMKSDYAKFQAEVDKVLKMLE